MLLDDLPPHARSYLEGMVFDKGLDPRSFYDTLPEKWSTVTYFNAPPDSVFSENKLTVETTFNGCQGAESSRVYVAEYSVDPHYPFYYYEVAIESLFCGNESR